MIAKSAPSRATTHFFWPLLLYGLALACLLFPQRWPGVVMPGLLLLLVSRGLIYRQTGRLYRPTILDPYLLLYLLFTIQGWLLSPLPALSTPKLLIVIAGIFGYYLFQDWVATTENPAAPQYLLLLAGGGLALLGLFFVTWPARQLAFLGWWTRLLPRLDSALDLHPNQLAGALLLVSPVALAYVWYNKHLVGRWLLGAGVALQFLLLLLLQSRSAWIALGAAAATWFLWSRPKILKWSSVAVLLFFLALLLLSYRYQRSGAILAGIVEVDAVTKPGDDAAVSWLSRQTMWSAAVQMVADYPALGAGLYVFDPVGCIQYACRPDIMPQNPVHVHNLYLETAISLGLPGLVTLLALLGTLLMAGQHPDVDPVMAPVLGATLIGYMTFNLFDLLAPGHKPGLFFWLLLALAVASLPPVAERRWKVPLGGPLLLWLLLLLTPLGWRNWAYNQLDRHHFNDRAPLSETAVSLLASDSRRMGLWAYQQGDLALAQSYWAQDPAAPILAQNQAGWRWRQDDAAGSLAWYDMALTLGPNQPLALFRRAQAKVAVGLYDGAHTDYQYAIAQGAALSPPQLAEFYFYYGKVLAREGNWEEAAAAYRQATMLDPHKFWYFEALGDSLMMLDDQVGAWDAFARAFMIR